MNPAKDDSNRAGDLPEHLSLMRKFPSESGPAP
jgi:hypothetical protein